MDTNPIISLKLIKTAKNEGIHLHCLPPHTTHDHILQPFDVGVYGPIKQSWKKIIKDYKTETMAANVSKEAFPGNTVTQNVIVPIE